MANETELETPPYPTLDSTGWITKPEAKADAVMLGYLQANYSQSVLFQGKIRSFQYTIQQNQHNQAMLVTAIEDDLKEIYGAYFDLAEVRCEIREPGKAYTGSDSAFDVELSIDVMQNGVRVSVGRLLSVIDSKVAKIVPIQLR